MDLKSLTRRGALAALPLAIGAAAYGGFRFRNSQAANPIAIKETGPFRAVYLVPDFDRSHVDAVLFYPFGERHNPLAEGLAHYLEHLVWQNVRRAGLDGGHHSNAWTSPSATGYFLSRVPDDLPNTIHRLTASASPLVVSTDYAVKERGIVAREYDQRLLDELLVDVWHESDLALYGNSPFSRRTLGTKQSIASFDLVSAQHLHDQSHQIHSATLLLRGPTASAAVGDAIANLSQWPEPRAAVLPERLEPWNTNPSAEIHERRVAGIGSPEMIFRQTYLLPTDFSWPEIMVARDILWEMVQSTRPGGTARALRYDAFVAKSISFGIATQGQVGLEMWCVAVPDAGVSLSELHARFSAHLQSLLNSPDTALFEEVKDRHFAPETDPDDLLDDNAGYLIDAMLEGYPYASASARARAARKLNYDRFKTFTQHLLAPRSAVTHLVSNL